MDPIPLDTTGLDCPLPILKARKVLAGLQTGDHLSVEATDPGALMDFPAFCRQAGHTLLSQETVASARFGSVYRFLIVKG